MTIRKEMASQLCVERLEDRQCMAVDVQVVGDDLRVQGVADGEVSIRATGDGAFEVTDNGQVVAQVTGATDDLFVRLDRANESLNDAIQIDLGGQTIDRIVVDLGNGDNRLTIENGTIESSLTFGSREGDDSLNLASNLTIEKSVYLAVGNGDNSIAIESNLGRSLSLFSGNGEDTVSIGTEASIARNVMLNLGRGDNRTSVRGEIDGVLHLCTGIDDDTLEILATAQLGALHVQAGDGNNSLSIQGDVAGDLLYEGNSGQDTITIGSESSIAGNVRAKLGAGENSVDHQGAIQGDLRVVSANAEDSVTVGENATVDGETQLGLGEQTPRRRGRHVFHHPWMR